MHAVWRSFVTSWCFPLDATLADILGRAGHADEGVRLIDGTLLVAEQRGAHWWDAELHRIRAGLLQAAGAPDGPAIETELERAVTTARAGEARWFELRATNDLARLWSERGERRKAYELLTPLYGWFTEGFDTPDLRNAKALIDGLG
jgi:predicted ATPase